MTPWLTPAALLDLTGRKSFGQWPSERRFPTFDFTT